MFAQLPLGLNTFGPLSRNSGRQSHRAARFGSGRHPWCAKSKRPLVTQRETVRHLLRVGLVQRLTKFAAINFGVLADFGLHILRIIVPALQMPRAEFPFSIFLIAGALPRLAHLDLLFCRRSRDRCRSCGRWWRSRRRGRGLCGRRCCRWCCRLRCGFLGHS